MASKDGNERAKNNRKTASASMAKMAWKTNAEKQTLFKIQTKWQKQSDAKNNVTTQKTNAIQNKTKWHGGQAPNGIDLG
jgi:hypothetical protein